MAFLALWQEGRSRGRCGGHGPLCLSPPGTSKGAPCSQREGSETSRGSLLSPLCSSHLLPRLPFRVKAQEKKWDELVHVPGGHLPDSAHRGHRDAGDDR